MGPFRALVGPPWQFRFLCVAIVLAWMAEVIFVGQMRGLSIALSPIFLLFACLGFKWPQPQRLWWIGLIFGLFQDLTSGALFGLWGCTYAWVGWLFFKLRDLMEAEDPIFISIWTALMTLVCRAIYAIIVHLLGIEVAVQDQFFWMLLSALAHGAVAFLVFPQIYRKYPFPTNHGLWSRF